MNFLFKREKKIIGYIFLEASIFKTFIKKLCSLIIWYNFDASWKARDVKLVHLSIYLVRTNLMLLTIIIIFLNFTSEFINYC